MIELRKYQKQASDKIVFLLQNKGCAYLAGETRTGKTCTILSAAKQICYKRILFITKKKAIESIRQDALALKVDIVVTNYEQLKKFQNTEWDLLIADEAHSLGAYPKPSLRQRYIRTISYKNICFLSGTPSPESFSQLFHQYALTNCVWKEYRNFYEWSKAGYVNITQRKVGTGQIINNYSNANKQLILKDIEPYIVRMTQKEAGFKAEIEEEVKLIKMQPITYKIAKEIIKDGISQFVDVETSNKRFQHTILADTGAKRLSKLRQIYSGTCISEEGIKLIFDRSKVNYIKSNYKNNKIAIMYTFDAEGKMLRDAFGKRATDSPEDFNKDPNAVFIGQVKASREGVNLSTASHLIFLGIDYAALSYMQSRDRLSFRDRIKPPKIHYIFAMNGIEPRVLKVVKNKKDFTVSYFRHIRELLSS